MRVPSLALALLAALLVALAGDARAQLSGDGALTLRLAPWPDAAAPRVAPVATTLEAEVDCFLLAGSLTGGKLELTVDAQPSWSTVVISPPAHALAHDACEDDRLVVTSQVVATADESAPAFRPGEVRVVGLLRGSLDREAHAEARAPLQASYFAVLDVGAHATLAKARPGETVEFGLWLVNHGNGATRATLDVVAPPGAQVRAPAPVLLESKQEGGTRTRADLTLVVRAPQEPGPHAIEVRANGTYALDASLPGDTALVSLLVDVEGAPLSERPVPLPPAWPLVALALAGLAPRFARRHV